MEFLIAGILVGMIAFNLLLKKVIENKVLEGKCELAEEITKHFRKMEAAYKTADIDEVNKRIVFLESLIEAGFTQQRDRIEKLENIEKARMRDLENALNETRPVQS